MNNKNTEQLTFGQYGHTMHHCQVISPDNQWIVYDIRNEDSEIGSTTRIERVNIKTKEVQILYETKNANEFGPGVGAVTYAPNKNHVMFIHGIEHATKEKPYGISRRTGVAIDIENPNIPIFMDARDVQNPYTKGALRGGTHSHCWHPNGELISFTYNDEILNSTERTVGVMFNKKVNVPNDYLVDQISGNCFSIIITPLVAKAKSGSDDIEKAFDECWLGTKSALAFQGWIRDIGGNKKTEIFIAELPEDLTKANFSPLQGTSDSYPGIPKNIKIKRVTYTLQGVSNFRHWLRSSADGKMVYFLMEDEFLVTNIFCVSVDSGKIKQITNHKNSINSPFNISPDGQKIIYICNDALIFYNINTNNPTILLENNKDIYGIPNFDKTGKYVFYNQYVYINSDERYLQIFKIKL